MVKCVESRVVGSCLTESTVSCPCASAIVGTWLMNL